MCEECYTDKSRITPLLKPIECLENHTQYICGTCGRYICIEYEPKRGLYRWNFPFKSLEIAKLYLRAADYVNKKACGIYEILSDNGRASYKIFVGREELTRYLQKNKDKSCNKTTPLFMVKQYKEYPNTQIRRVTTEEIKNYIEQRHLEQNLQVSVRNNKGLIM